MREFKTQKAEIAREQLMIRRSEVQFNLRDYLTYSVVERYKQGVFIVPDYRRSFNWFVKDRSYFIESVLLGLPLPVMVWAETGPEDGRIEIVDGVQRISSLVRFFDNKFKLCKLETLTELNGFKFSDLSEYDQASLRYKPLRTAMLPFGTDQALRQTISSRLNQNRPWLSRRLLKKGPGQAGGRYLN
jgi:hypothetical protein